MRKLLLALSAVFMLASFTNNTDETIILKDIEGTLLQSYAVIETVDGQHTITFTVDANTIVTSNTIAKKTHIHLVENGNSGLKVTHSITFNSNSVDFNNYFESNIDVASSSDQATTDYVKRKKPKRLLAE